MLESIIENAKKKEMLQMEKGMKGNKRKKLVGIQKLDDANEAGSKISDQCTLILTEGDSAKSLAMSGLEVIGRDKYGVFPLKGKFLNVREAPATKILENLEVQNLIKIIGLQVGKNYSDAVERKSLRYGGVMVMADQDHDGSHIKGLIINFFHHFWPSLIRCNIFMRQFITPIMKATRHNHPPRSFYCIQDFTRWSQTISSTELNLWKIKYYKGLGTSTDKEAKEYFSAIGRHKIDFLWQDVEDDQQIDLVFNKKKADDRKRWLGDYDSMLSLDNSITTVRYKEFIDKEFIAYSNSDNIRSIPQVIDGLKPG